MDERAKLRRGYAGEGTSAPLRTGTPSGEELLASYGYLTSILESMLDAVIVAHPDGTIRTVNRAALELLGYAEEELVGKPVGTVFEEEEEEEEEEAFFRGTGLARLVREGAARDVEMTLLAKSGERIPVILNGSVIREEDGRLSAVVGVARDIRERKRAERRIKHLTEVLRAIRNVNQLITREKNRQRLLKGVCETLIEARGYHYAWVAIFGEFGELVTSAEAGFGEDFLPFLEHLRGGELPICGRKALGQPDVVVIGDPRSTCADCPWARKHPGKTSMTVRLEHEGKVYGMLTVSSTIDLDADEEERSLFQEVAADIAFALHSIELEETRRQAEELYATLINNSQVGVYIVQDGKMQFANPKFQEFTGFSEEELLGRDSLSLVHPDDRDMVRGNAVKLLKGESSLPYEFRAITRDGRIRWVMEMVTSISYWGKRAALGSHMDITEYRQAVQAMKESEDKYRGLVTNVKLGIFRASPKPAGPVLEANPAMEEITGYSMEELLGMKVQDLYVHPEEREVVLEELATRAKPTKELHWRKKDGVEIDVAVTIGAVRNDAGNILYLDEILEDITERKRMERRIQHLTEVLRAIRNVNQLITREKDRDRLLKGVCDTLIEARGYHSAWMAIFGESGELVTTAESGYGEDFLPMVEYLKRGELPPCGRIALRQSGAVVYEDTLFNCTGCPSSEKHPGRASMTVRLAHAGKVYGLLHVFVPASLNSHEEERSLLEEVAGDIAFALHSIELEEKHKLAEEELRQAHDTLETRVEERTAALEEAIEALRVEIAERKRMERQIEEQREYLAAVLSDAPDAIVTLDVSGHIVGWNTGAEWLYGYTHDEARGNDPVELLTRPNREAAKGIVFSINQMLSGEKVPPTEVVRYHKDGTPKDVILAGSPIIIRGKLVGAVIVYTDITERKRAEKELRAKEMQLIHVDRLSSLGEMATGVAHEINQPLAIISMAAEGRLRDIERGRFDVSILPQELEDILKNVRRIDRIITHMRTFARRAGEWESVNPERVLDDVFILLGEQFRLHQVSISREIEAGLPSIKVDVNQLEQVFVNILTNARQVLDERAEEAERDGKAFEKRMVCGISRAKEEAGEYVIFEFADNAYGVPDELKTRVFEPFFTTKDVGKGTGLGLSIVYGIVTQSLGGRIWVEDNEMGGASFKVALPVVGCRL